MTTITNSDLISRHHQSNCFRCTPAVQACSPFRNTQQTGGRIVSRKMKWCNHTTQHSHVVYSQRYFGMYGGGATTHYKEEYILSVRDISIISIPSLRLRPRLKSSLILKRVSISWSFWCVCGAAIVVPDRDIFSSLLLFFFCAFFLVLSTPIGSCLHQTFFCVGTGATEYRPTRM